VTRLGRAGGAAALALAPASCGSPAADAPAPPAAADAMPAAMRGRWGLTADDCAPAPPRREGLIEVEATGMRFHESRARLREVAEIGPRRIVAAFEYRGEGRTWVLRERYDLMDGDRALVRRDAGRAPRLEADLYLRCPG
jgi:hypothetical protein